MVLSCFRCSDSSSRGAAFQNVKYGDGKRVHNATARSGNSPQEYRCTICQNERTSGK